MIKVIRSPVVAGKCHFSVVGYDCGRVKSRQPLLDACRLLKSLGVEPPEQIGLFREGREAPDLITTVGVGAGLTVSENDRHGPVFQKFKEFSWNKPDEAQ